MHTEYIIGRKKICLRKEVKSPPPPLWRNLSFPVGGEVRLHLNSENCRVKIENRENFKTAFSKPTTFQLSEFQAAKFICSNAQFCIVCHLADFNNDQSGFEKLPRPAWLRKPQIKIHGVVLKKSTKHCRPLGSGHSVPGKFRISRS
jgi:hypothetical protein